MELEQQLQEMRQQQTKMASAAAKVEEASGNIPDPQVSIGCMSSWRALCYNTIIQQAYYYYMQLD